MLSECSSSCSEMFPRVYVSFDLQERFVRKKSTETVHVIRTSHSQMKPWPSS